MTMTSGSGLLYHTFDHYGPHKGGVIGQRKNGVLIANAAGKALTNALFNLQERGRYTLRHTTNDVKCLVKELKYKMDINTLHKMKDDREVRLNDIARVSLQTSAPLHYDRYRRNRATGSFILIDEQTNNTVAAGMIVG